MSIVSAGVVTTSFFLVAADAYSRPFCVFDVDTVNIFSSVHSVMQTLLDKYFSNCFKWLSLVWQFTELSLPEQGDFVHKHSTKRYSDI